MAKPNNIEAELLPKFRKRVADILTTEEQRHDAFLLRWLRARELDMNKAEDMIRTSFIWRKDNNVDHVLDVKLVPFFAKEYPFCISGVDKLGQPVLLVPVGKWDCRKVNTDQKTEEFKLYTSSFFERILRRMRELNASKDSKDYPVTQMTAIIDWEGFPYAQLLSVKAIQNLLHVASVYEAHYPEVMFRGFFINCPSFFAIVLSLLKPILAPKTLAKITSHKSDRQEWEEAMKEVIHVEELDKLLTFDANFTS